MLTPGNEETHRLFEIMKAAESVAYAESEKARKARYAWEDACKNKFLKNHPEINSLIEKVNDLKRQLAKAQETLHTLTERNNVTHMFRNYVQ